MADETAVAEPKTAQELAVEKRQAEVAAENAKRSGKGTRLRVGQTRGRNPQVISYEAFDESLPDTLPVTLDEFMKLSATDDEKVLVGYMLDGFNSTSYREASDPVAEFVNRAWPEEVQKNFRNAVKNYAAGAETSIEEAANLIRTAFDKKHAPKT